MGINIFIEGLPGAGKSTLLNRLAQEWPEYHVYREGDLSPVELAWCSYMTESEWKTVLHKYPELEKEIRDKTMAEEDRHIVAYTQILAESRAFYQEMEQREIYNGRVDFRTFHDVIMRRYSRFCGENGKEMWYPLMLNFLKESPYGKTYGYEGLEDVVAHFKRRRALEKRILREIIKEDCLILEAKGEEFDRIKNFIE